MIRTRRRRRIPYLYLTVPCTSRNDARARAERKPEARKGSLLTFFVEEDGDGPVNLNNSINNSMNGIIVNGNNSFRQDEGRDILRGGNTAPASQKRGISMPYSPQGIRGSLATGALSPPVPTSGGARRQSSLKADLYIM